ncbi:MAG: serine O-acetyltransferase [Clostridia bacterium]|nr:serine O-acetyltransferase [Clostridia bacterium]
MNNIPYSKKKFKSPDTAKIKKKISALKAGVNGIVEDVKYDVQAVKERDPAARNSAEVLLLYSGVHALMAYRVSHKLYEKERYFEARALSQIARHFTGIEIHPGAKIGKGLVIDHGMGVVIGETAEIGDNCTLYQGVTLGGTGKDVGKRHPTLGNGVLVGAGAKILGPLKIGDNSKIAANAVVLSEIPDNATAVGIPAKVVKRDGQRVDPLDHVHMPDPVAQQIKALESKLAELEKQVAELSAEPSKRRKK